MDWIKILQVKNVTKNYGKGESRTAALRGISFDELEGEFLGIMGDSGSGKTTLLNCIAAMTRPTSGEILLNGADISAFKGARLAKYRGGKIGYLYQEFELLDNLTARENIVLPLALHGITQKQAQGRLMELAGRLDIVPVLDRFPSQMSGGQKQRVAAARALITQPEILLADEPTGNLDEDTQDEIMEIFKGLAYEEQKCIILVTHSPVVASLADEVYALTDTKKIKNRQKGV